MAWNAGATPGFDALLVADDKAALAAKLAILSMKRAAKVWL